MSTTTLQTDATSSYQLPYQDELGFCNILMSAIGGDGANMAGKLLFKIGCETFGLDGGFDAKYGSEKKGTPTDVSVRFCTYGTEVRASGPTRRPQILVAFRERLIRPLELNRGLAANATVIVNSTKTPAEIRELLQLHSGTIICLDATKIATETRSRLNMPMLAMLCHELKFPDEKVKEVIAKRWPRAAEANLAAYDRAVSGAQRQSFEADGKYPLAEPAPVETKIGYLNMLIGGTIDAMRFNNSDRDNRMGGLGLVPVFAKEVCINCAACLATCADPGAIVWKDGEMMGIAEEFCKGCWRCVQVCPQTKKGKALQMPEVLREDK